MNLIIIGVNHKTAPVVMRERLAFSPADISDAGESLNILTDGHLIVATCNRLEIYAVVDEELIDAEYGDKSQSTDPFTRLSQWLAHTKNISLATLTPHLYHYRNAQAVSHWLRVASGLDSMILGEPQIFGQIKRAVQTAKDTGHLSKPLGWLAEQVFAGAKQVRHDTNVGTQAVSLGFASAKLVTQIFDDPASLTLLIVASGEMNRLVAKHISELGVKRILIANRSRDRANAFASELAGAGRHIEVHPLDALPELLVQADIVSSCSGSMHALIDKKMVKSALKKRRYRPVLMVDLAVPRDIEPNVGKLDDVYLYSIDDLQHVIAGNLEKRRQASIEAELLVSQLVVGITERWQVRQIGADIQTYRQQAEKKANAVLEEALKLLAQGNTPSETVLTELTYKLTQTLTHPPSQLLRQVAQTGDTELVSQVASGLNEAYRKDSRKNETGS